MKPSLRVVFCSLFLTAVAAQNATSDLITDGYFTDVHAAATTGLTTLYGQFGTGTGSTLTVGNWTTTGYNFVYAPGTADAGGKAGASSGQPNEAPGEYNTSAGYGNTYLWGSNNGGSVTLPATDPAGGNFIAADGAFQIGGVSQMVTGLSAGDVYALNFYWAAAQQAGFTGATTETWTATLGTQSFTTPTINLSSKGFSGWVQQTFFFTASASSETLTFLATGTPNGEPPFSLLGGVSMVDVPEPSSWLVFVGFGAGCIFFVWVRRRRWAANLAEGSAE